MSSKCSDEATSVVDGQCGKASDWPTSPMSASPTSASPSTSGPASSKRPSVCNICKSSAVSFHLNYGAHSCLSCRAFFRRTVQNGREPKFACKSGDGSCRSAMKTRRRCKRCRFDLCLEAGMRREYVLDESQIRLRFRRMIRKKKKQAKELKAKLKLESKANTELDAELTKPKTKGKRGRKKKTTADMDDAPPRTTRALQPKTKQTKEQSLSSQVQEIGSDDLSKPTTTLSRSCQDTPSLDFQYLEMARPNTDASSAQIPNLEDYLIAAPSPGKDEAVGCDLDSLFADLSGSSALSSVWHQPSYHSSASGIMSTSMAATFRLNIHSDIPDCKVEDNCNFRGPSGQTYALHGVSHLEEPVFMNYVKRVRHSWKEAFQSFHPSHVFVQALSTLHNRNGPLQDKAIWREHLDRISDLFRAFAYKQPEFSSLSLTDQRTLLKKNTPLFVQYFLGRYFHASTTIEQLQWILLSHPVTEQILVSPNLPPVSVAEFNSVVRLYSDTSALQLYSDNAKRLNLPSLQFHCNSVIALTCLFSANYATLLEDSSSVRSNLDYVYSVSDWAHDRFNCASKEDLCSIVEVLEAMANTFECNVSFNSDDQTSVLKQEVAPRYSWDEEQCVQEQLKYLDNSYEVVPFGEEIVHEFVMYSLDVPLSKKFFPTSFSLWAERYKFILKNSGALDHISDREHALAATRATFEAIALMVCKGESCKTGFEQLMVSIGQADKDLVHKYVGSSLSQTKLKKLSMKDNEMLKLLDQSTLRRYMSIAEGLSDLVEDTHVYRILTLITIFCADGVREMSTLGNRYLNMARRRLMQLEGEASERKFARFKSGLRDLRELAQILQGLVLTVEA